MTESGPSAQQTRGMGPPLLELRGLRKQFGSLRALDGVSLCLGTAEIHCVLGENGAGKSTLMHILAGVLRPDEGEIWIDGRRIAPRDPSQARAAGIGMVHQHFTLVEALSVVENLALSVADMGTERGWRLERGAIAERAVAVAAEIGIDLPAPESLVRELSVGTRQRLEILKAVMTANRLLILDEPTAVLTPGEVEPLFRLLRKLRAQGRSILFITHKLREVMEVADRISVMRQGRLVGTHVAGEVTQDRLIEDMLGQSHVEEVSVRRALPPQRRLSVEGLVVGGVDSVSGLDNVSLEVRAGEILGIAGVDGNGQRELYEVLMGLRQVGAGSIRIDSHVVTPAAPLSPRRARAMGVACIPPDRQHEGLALSLSILDNLLLNSAALRRLARHGWLRWQEARAEAATQVARFDIRCAGLEQPAGALSGGNQQRIIIARELAAARGAGDTRPAPNAPGNGDAAPAPRLLVACSPTRGLDVQAARSVWQAIREAAEAGCGVVLISTDLDELLELSDVVAVLYRGELSPPLHPPFDTLELGAWMAGERRASRFVSPAQAPEPVR